MSEDRPVYSTDKNIAPKGLEKKKPLLPAKGPARVRLEKKGRGGKQVTIIDNIPLAEAEAKELMRSLQKRFACGASLKDGEILLSGDFCEQTRAILKG